MLSYKHRFHGHSSLRYVYTHSRAIRSKYAALRFTENPKRTTSRFAVVISKKVLKSAVGRNRIRRRIYEVFRKHCDAINTHRDIVIIVGSAELRTMSASELETIIVSMLKEAKLYKTPL